MIKTAVVSKETVVLLGGKVSIVIPSQTPFLIRQESVTGHGSKQSNSLGNQQLELSTRVDQVVCLETAANLCAK